ncbi:MAG TPA: undecaprenyl-diphosphate phosphatase [Actinocrinis sp.]|nr:undecaprenyl-diphosphate phosphatase [Actinocrinis sp.]HEV2344384.1 undecaprenyl-diphosphate phosphatase [Actinocrinis sp.]
MTELSYLQAIVIGLLQGVTELFPISSLGHSVLVPAWIGGSWQHLVTENSSKTSEQSPYLAFIVALHVATALALITFYWRDWVRIITALITTLRTRRIETSTERLAWLLVIATIPVGLTGLALEHTFRTLFAKPLAASIFLTINGVILFGAERLRKRAEQAPAAATELVGVGAGVSAAGDVGVADGGRRAATPAAAQVGGRRQLETLGYKEAGIIGLFQTFALLAGISRSGITMAAGLLRGLSHEDAAKFSFLLATPVILAAGVLKLPSLAGPAGAHIHGQIVAGFLTAGIAAYLSVRFLTRYFTTRTLTPFAVYCLLGGAISIGWFATH